MNHLNEVKTVSKYFLTILKWFPFIEIANYAYYGMFVILWIEKCKNITTMPINNIM